MWLHTIFPEITNNGYSRLSIIAKKTFEIKSGQCFDTENKIPIFASDILENKNDAMNSETIAESDLTGLKDTTDIIVNADAFAPKDKKVFTLLCKVCADQLKKEILIIGDRMVKVKPFWTLGFSDPQPFSQKPIGYKNAYGGTCKNKDGTVFSYYPNSLGKGFAIKGCINDPSSITLPTQESPCQLLTPDKLILNKASEWQKAPKPVSLGWTKRFFYPRYTFATRRSINDEITYKKELSDSLFFQGASEGLYGYLFRGGEYVCMENLDRKYEFFEFSLPDQPPVISIKSEKRPVTLDPLLQTVVIDMKTKLVTMVWRAVFDHFDIEMINPNLHFNYEVI